MNIHAIKIKCKHRQLSVAASKDWSGFYCSWCGTKIKKASTKESKALFNLYRNGMKFMLKTINSKLSTVLLPPEK